MIGFATSTRSATLGANTVLFGGRVNITIEDSTWIWSGSSWDLPPPQSPLLRATEESDDAGDHQPVAPTEARVHVPVGLLPGAGVCCLRGNKLQTTAAVTIWNYILRSHE